MMKKLRELIFKKKKIYKLNYESSYRYKLDQPSNDFWRDEK